MLPGKKYTPEDILLMLRRRYWLVLVPFAVVAATTAVAVQAFPNWYRSDALIQVIPQRVPQSYVRSAVNSPIEDRLNSMAQQILNRTRLEGIIQDFDLYKEDRRTEPLEDIVERMRTKEIRMQVVKGDAFQVSYIGQDPRIVKNVTQRLADLFIEENVKLRGQLADGTSEFLERQLEDARRRLIDQEKRLEGYRRAHTGELPSQLDSNLQAIQNIQMQIQSIVESLNRDRDQRFVLQRQLADVEAAAEPVVAPATPPGDAADGGTAARQLEMARAQLKGAETRLKPEHPDIGILKRRIRELERAAEAEALAKPVTEGPSRAEIARQQKIGTLQREIEQIDLQIAQKTAEEKRLRAASGSYQARVEAAPARETELVELTRDYTGLQATYSSLLQKKEDSKLSANLERLAIGEQFRLLDPARLPERPFKPNRPMLYLGGMAAGLAIGLAFVGLLEYRDRSFRSDEDLTRLLSLPVLAVVPLMQSETERTRASRRRILGNVALGSTVTACLAVVAYAFLR